MERDFFTEEENYLFEDNRWYFFRDILDAETDYVSEFTADEGMRKAEAALEWYQ